MENVNRALIMAFSMIIFVIGLAYSMYLINRLTTTSNVLLESITTTNYYDNIEISGGGASTREVGVDTIIPTLYRYYKENYAVKIYDKNDKLIQIFDVGLESKIAKAAAYTRTTVDPNNKKESAELISLNKSIYNDKTNSAYLFEAPWTGSTDEDTRTRIDYFVNGTNGYINNTLVKYGDKIQKGVDKGFLAVYGNSKFIESFVEYAYTGETISTENGLETITGNTQESSKIIITYKEKN